MKVEMNRRSFFMFGMLAAAAAAAVLWRRKATVPRPVLQSDDQFTGRGLPFVIDPAIPNNAIVFMDLRLPGDVLAQSRFLKEIKKRMASSPHCLGRIDNLNLG